MDKGVPSQVRAAAGDPTRCSVVARVDGDGGDERRRTRGRKRGSRCPTAEPEDTHHLIDHTHGVVGFPGGWSRERLPMEVAITESMCRLKRISRPATTVA